MEDLETTVHCRNTARLALLPAIIVAGLLGPAACLNQIAPGPPVPLLSILSSHAVLGWLFAAVAVIPLFFLSNLFFVARPGRVREGGIFVGDRCLLAFPARENASYQRVGPSGGIVRFVGRRGRSICDVVVRSDDEAIRVLTNASPAEARRWWVGAGKKYGGALFGAGTAIAIIGTQQQMGWLLVPIMAAWVLVLRRRAIVFENDRLVVRLPMKTQIPFRSVREASALGTDTLRVEHEGGSLDIEVGDELELIDGRLERRRDVILEQLTSALERDRAREDIRALAGALVRGSRSVAEWLTDLSTAKGQNAYRDQRFRDEDLWSILEEPTVPDEARAAAALLLVREAPNAAPATKARIRVAASDVASPQLRVAIDQVLDAEDAGDNDAFAALARGRRRA